MNWESHRRRSIIMKTSTKHSKDSRSMLARFGKIAMALAFGGLLCTFPMTSVLAAGHRGGGRGGYYGGGHRGGWGGGHWGGGYWGGGYYAPGPYYYGAPEPYDYYGPEPYYGPYYGPGYGPGYEYGPRPPSGFGLFFGL